MQTERALKLIACFVVGTISLAGCSAGSSTGGKSNGAGNNNFMTPQQMEQEYLQESRVLQLPEGATWPPLIRQPPAPDENGVLHEQSYEAGYGVALAQDAWFCAWEKEWLKQRDINPERARVALTTLNGIKSMKNYTQYSDESVRALTDEVLAKASNGDPSAMARDVELNCTQSQ